MAAEAAALLKAMSYDRWAVEAPKLFPPLRAVRSRLAR
jgi:hypothetical protein